MLLILMAGLDVLCGPLPACNQDRQSRSPSGKKDATKDNRDRRLTNSIGMEFRKSWSDSVDSGSPPLVRSAGV